MIFLFFPADLGNFQIKHIPSGRCWGFDAANTQDNGRIKLDGNCDNDFTYDANGHIKHLTSSQCLYTNASGHIKMRSTCDDMSTDLIDRNKQGVMMIKPISAGCAIHVMGTASQGAYLENQTATSLTSQQDGFVLMPGGLKIRSIRSETYSVRKNPILCPSKLDITGKAIEINLL